VALRHLQLIGEWRVLDHVGRVAGHLAQRLATDVADRPGVGHVRQRGLMVGIELWPPPGATRWGRRVCAAAVERGVLLRPLGDVVVLMPPLTTTKEEIDTLVDVLGAAIDAVQKEEAG
jgi:adenosylmethionine-8-amino-7-oxononanoate aminotransferase